MIEQKYSDIVTPELLAGNIDNNEFEGFRADYRVLHCLIRKYQPLTFMEIGTNMGTGTNIICNAGKNWLMKVYSLDLPTELAHISLQHPISEGKGDKVGSNCKFAYTQLRGNSLDYDFKKNICEGYYIDGEHTEENVFNELANILRWAKPKIVILHDTDMPEVMKGITRICENPPFNGYYDSYRVIDTRISYLVLK